MLFFLKKTVCSSLEKNNQLHHWTPLLVNLISCFHDVEMGQTMVTPTTFHMVTINKTFLTSSNLILLSCESTEALCSKCLATMHP